MGTTNINARYWQFWYPLPTDVVLLWRILRTCMTVVYIREPPAPPVTNFTRPSPSTIITGAMAERGRLRGSTRLIWLFWSIQWDLVNLHLRANIASLSHQSSALTLKGIYCSLKKCFFKYPKHWNVLSYFVNKSFFLHFISNRPFSTVDTLLF